MRNASGFLLLFAENCSENQAHKRAAIKHLVQIAIGKFIAHVCTHVANVFVSLNRMVATKLISGHMMQQMQIEMA